MDGKVSMITKEFVNEISGKMGEVPTIQKIVLYLPELLAFAEGTFDGEKTGAKKKVYVMSIVDQLIGRADLTEEEKKEIKGVVDAVLPNLIDVIIQVDKKQIAIAVKKGCAFFRWICCCRCCK